MASALVFIVVGMVWWQYRGALHTSDALDGGTRSAGGEMNILLIGLDSRKDQDGNQLPPEVLDKLHAGDGEEGGYNTNTLILMHIPAGGGRATAFSIPRDDLVNIPGEHPDKIKKAYGYAKNKAEQQLADQGVTDQHQLETQSRDAGRRATLDVVRQLTGVPIDHFAEVNLAGFYDLASTLNGVEVCLNHPVQDGYSGADFPAGRQVLNASQALSFVRQRRGLTNGDLDRTHRQQAFLASVAAKLRTSGTLTDGARLQGLIQIARKDVVIDSGWDVLNFAQQEQDLSGGNMQFQTLPITGYTKNGNGEDINLIDPDQLRDIVRTAFGYQRPAPPAPPAPTTTIDMFNGSGSTGLAGRMSDLLSAQGFGKGEVSNTAYQNRSAVSYAPGQQADAKNVARLLGGLAVVPDGTVPSGHVRVTLGATFHPPQPNAASPAAALQALEQPVRGQDDDPGPTGAAPPPPPPPPPRGTPDVPCVD